ncbi:MAG: AgmX/PglI C-terminal domain-containing protein [Sorangiineae bacterium]|nr:AgmX/PglI C-terminal domain-containing protein [Polyangiaceae bacterium]MEB2322663.1 AgmX/PglI C-terminal domain-containing protein [Sorangiineae bacterium]
MPEPSLPPPPPKTGGNSGFTAAAIVMLLLMGGLIYWKVSGKTEPAPAPSAAPPVATPETPVLDEPPPPPPPSASVEPDAGKAPVKTGGIRPAGPGVCGGTCDGTAPAALQSALAAKAGQARGCYERALRLNPTLQGRLVVAVRVGPQGQVCSASLASNSLGDPTVGSCVVQMFRSGSFPPAQGGCVDTQVPMSFVAKQ